MNASWKFDKDCNQEIRDAAEKAFRPISNSAVINMGNEHNFRSERSGWFQGTRVGTVEAISQRGQERTWEVTITQAGSIMQTAHNASKWQIHIRTID